MNELVKIRQDSVYRHYIYHKGDVGTLVDIQTVKDYTNSIFFGIVKFNNRLVPVEIDNLEYINDNQTLSDKYQKDYLKNNFYDIISKYADNGEIKYSVANQILDELEHLIQ